MENEKEIGTVISTNEGPSPSEIDFVVNKGLLHRGQFVELDYSEGTLIGLVTNLVKTNRYFERAESVKEFESQGKKLFEQFPTEEWEYLVAKTKPLGVFNKDGSARATFPPSPGTKVRIASAENLQKFFKFDKENGLHLGSLEYHNVDVNLNLTKLLQKHLAILAMSGAGKSYLTSVLFEEILSRKKEQGRIGVVVLDPHGEYSSFGFPPKIKESKDYSNQTRVIKGQDIKIGVSKLSISMIAGIIPGLSGPQKRDLGRIFAKLKEEMRSGTGPFDFNAVKREILKSEEVKKNTQAALMAWIYSLEAMNLFSKVDTPSIKDIVSPGVLTIIDLSDIVNMRKKQIIVSFISQTLFNERRKKTVCPFLLVLEEAHQFVPQYSDEETSASKGIIRTIAREGRKFGASLCLISQRPVQLDTTALSQCNTQIILRVTNPNDLKHISESSEGIDSRSLDMITVLQVGEALMVGEAVRHPMFFKVRKRNSVPSIHEVTLEESAKIFEENKEKDKKELENFI